MALYTDENFITWTYENEPQRVRNDSAHSDHTYCYITDNPDEQNEQEKRASRRGVVYEVCKWSSGFGVVLIISAIAAVVLVAALLEKPSDNEVHTTAINVEITTSELQSTAAMTPTTTSHASISAAGSTSFTTTSKTKRTTILPVTTSIESTTSRRRLSTTPNPRWYYEKECACTPSKLWLDVVIVIDNSLGMPKEELDKALTNLCKVFAQVTITQGEGHQSRVGVVTYGIKADARHNLTEFNSFHEFCNRIMKIRQTNATSSNLKEGLEKAKQMFRDGRPSGFRKNVKEVILIHASVYKQSHFEDAKPLADQMKISGKEIVVVAFDQRDNPRALMQIREIATEGFYYIYEEYYIFGDVQHALCTANCFCRKKWLQYTLDTLRFGSCLRIGPGQFNWEQAKRACLRIGHESGHLATVFSKEKHNFIALMFINDSRVESPYIYHIGLSYDTKQSDYLWEQPVGSDPAKIPLRGSSFRIWNRGYPSLSGGNCVDTAQYSTKFEFGWQNIHCRYVYKPYICQMNSCDTDNYCANIEE
ncbi:unnamed protein product [Cylicocyclus nassatus]|uniref:Uncharacterized protein n=1 Tax=Cylicocyclus nassatus TaxID=53992 RepID=A0AA36HGW5_CYLNA|nr:unnamed protein product [Cylicocyclus nassatus]